MGESSNLPALKRLVAAIVNPEKGASLPFVTIGQWYNIR